MKFSLINWLNRFRAPPRRSDPRNQEQHQLQQAERKEALKLRRIEDVVAHAGREPNE